MMQDHPVPDDMHDEGYFASFTDMLVGILFIFIILLMIVANNYQEATEAVVEATQSLEEERAKVLEQAQDTAREEAQQREIETLQAMLAEKTAEAAKALEEVRTLEAAKALYEAKARETAAIPSTIQTLGEVSAAPSAKAEEEAVTRQFAETQQNLFNDSRAKVLRRIQETLTTQGYDVRANINQGTLLIPENLLFDSNWNPSEVSYRGKQALGSLAAQLGKYLPCISPTPDSGRLVECGNIGVAPNDGLNAIFIDDYPDIQASREEKLLLAMQRTISVFNELKAYEPYLDKGLKNVAGAPILDIKVNQARRQARNQGQNNQGVKNFVVLRFIMRKPNERDILRLRNSAND